MQIDRSRITTRWPWSDSFPLIRKIELTPQTLYIGRRSFATRFQSNIRELKSLKIHILVVQVHPIRYKNEIVSRTFRIWWNNNKSRMDPLKRHNLVALSLECSELACYPASRRKLGAGFIFPNNRKENDFNVWVCGRRLTRICRSFHCRLRRAASVTFPSTGNFSGLAFFSSH